MSTRPPHPQQTLRRLARLARLLDARWGIPGTPWRFGLDGLLGLIPGAGDVAGAALSAYIVWEAHRLGASKLTIARMIANVGIEALIGVVPVLGDLFDVAFKANIRNLRLLESDAALGDNTRKPAASAPSAP
jgi:hypothetical protein